MASIIRHGISNSTATPPASAPGSSGSGQHSSGSQASSSSTTNINAVPPKVAPPAAQPALLVTPAIDEKELPKKQISTWSVLKSWRWEILAAVLALGVLICEIVILVHYNNKYLFLHWSHDWKINSVFAFLTTILEAAVMFYVAASMGQLRWHWYRKKQHRLDWLEIMTDASRPSGAMRLLFRKGMQRQFAAVGALIVIFLLGVNTFTQQVITQRIESFQLEYPYFNGQVPINTNYTWYDMATTKSIGTQQPMPDMIAAIQSGFYSYSDNNAKSLSVSAWTYCDGDSCEFGKYQSLGVCSQCEDISAEVHNPCASGNCTDSDYYTLTNGVDLSLLATFGILNLTADTNLTTSPAFNGVLGPLVVRFHAMIAKEAEANKTGQGATALQCAAWWCVKTYQGSVVNSTLHEDIIDTYTDTSPSARTQYGQQNEISLKPQDCYINDTTPTNSSYCTFVAGAYTQNALQNFLAAPNASLPYPAFLTGSLTYSGSGADRTWNDTTLLAGGLLSNEVTNPAITHEIRSGFNAMASQMTVDIRGALTSDYTNEFSFGPASYCEQKFHVRWGWIAYPAGIVVVSLIFLLTTIWMTRKDEAWKASVLPVIFHSFGGADREEFVRLDSVADMKKASRDRKVSLVRGEKGGHSAFKAGRLAPVHGHVYEVTQGVSGALGKAADMWEQSGIEP